MAMPRKAEKKEPGIWKLVDGRWLVDFRPGGRDSKPFRKIRDTLTDARQSKQAAIARFQNGESVTPAKDTRTLRALTKEWYDFHGHTLATGRARLLRLEALADALGNPRATKSTPMMFTVYRKERLESGISEKNLNHELGYLKAMFNELESAGLWKFEKPFDKIKNLKVPPKRLHYLSEEEMNRLMIAASESKNKDLLVQIELCLSTGARWGEAGGLQAEDVKNGVVAYIDTKNGRNRYVAIDKDMEDALLMGRAEKGPLFPTGTRKAFERAIDRAKIKLPHGQLTHVLRHSFASHFVMNGGDFLVLREILGHENIQMTMLYAHLAPSHLEDAKRLNPISKMRTKVNRTRCTSGAHLDEKDR